MFLKNKKQQIALQMHFSLLQCYMNLIDCLFLVNTYLVNTGNSAPMTLILANNKKRVLPTKNKDLKMALQIHGGGKDLPCRNL